MNPSAAPEPEPDEPVRPASVRLLHLSGGLGLFLIVASVGVAVLWHPEPAQPRLTPPRLPALPSMPALPALPALPTFPGDAPAPPTAPDPVPTAVPTDLPELPELPELPTLPEFPSFPGEDS